MKNNTYSSTFSVGVLISTYNNPKWLQKVLWGYAHQTARIDEILIADDGSGEETRQMLAEFEDILPIKHIWHPDEGYQKCRIMNRAVLAATSDYLIFTDQDCIPRIDFVETHVREAEEGYFLSGGYFKLPMDISEQITKSDIESQSPFSTKWLKNQGFKFTHKLMKLVDSKSFTNTMNKITPTKATWNGCNASTWTKDILAVNGFNEQMQYGGQDREFGERLWNFGHQSKQIRYSAICVHLDHKRPYKNQESIDKNLKIRKDSIKNKLVQTPYGITQLLESEKQKTD